MAQEDNLVVDAAERVFADLADPQTLLKQAGQDWRTPLWEALEEIGLPRAWMPEALGGHGLTMQEGFQVARAAGRAALPVPLVETMVAGLVAGRAGLSLPAGAATVVIEGVGSRVRVGEDGRLRLDARAVPFAGEVRSIVVVAARPAGAWVAVLPAGSYEVAPAVNLAGEACGAVRAEDQRPEQAAAVDWATDEALFVAATCRSLQIAGALQAMLQTSAQYAKERVAFEKPIARFQAVQQNLARLAGETAAAVAASESAADTLSTEDAEWPHRLLEVAAAKVRCGEAAETGSAIAHQVLGAIGFTEEHVLHRFTLRVLAWREDFGSEMAWARRLGETVGRQGGADLWRLLSAR